jgi:hypothetical protein
MDLKQQQRLANVVFGQLDHPETMETANKFMKIIRKIKFYRKGFSLTA